MFFSPGSSSYIWTINFWTCTLRSSKKFRCLCPTTSPEGWHNCLGCDLGFGIFKRSSGDPNVQTSSGTGDSELFSAKLLHGRFLMSTCPSYYDLSNCKDYHLDPLIHEEPRDGNVPSSFINWSNSELTLTCYLLTLRNSSYNKSRISAWFFPFIVSFQNKELIPYNDSTRYFCIIMNPWIYIYLLCFDPLQWLFFIHQIVPSLAGGSIYKCVPEYFWQNIFLVIWNDKMFQGLALDLGQPFPQEALVSFSEKWHLGSITGERPFPGRLGGTSGNDVGHFSCVAAYSKTSMDFETC